MPLTPAGDAPGFETHVKPMFREHDRRSMRHAFDLWSYDDVKSNSAAILAKVTDGAMPCDLTWPAENVAVLRAWIESGFPR